MHENTLIKEANIQDARFLQVVFLIYKFNKRTSNGGNNKNLEITNNTPISHCC